MVPLSRQAASKRLLALVSGSSTTTAREVVPDRAPGGSSEPESRRKAAGVAVREVEADQGALAAKHHPRKMVRTASSAEERVGGFVVTGPLAGPRSQIQIESRPFFGVLLALQSTMRYRSNNTPFA